MKKRNDVLSITLCILLFVPHLPAQSGGSTPAEVLDVLIANARTTGDQRAERRVTNLKFALGTLKPSEFKNIQCGVSETPLAVDVDQSQDVAGKLLEKILDKYLPAVAAAIASAPAAGVAVFLTSTSIAPDAVEIMNKSSTSTKEDVQKAARQLLQDTRVNSFKNLPRPRMAKIVACSIG